MQCEFLTLTSYWTCLMTGIHAHVFWGNPSNQLNCKHISIISSVDRALVRVNDCWLPLSESEVHLRTREGWLCYRLWLKRRMWEKNREKKNKTLFSEQNCLQLGNNRTPDRFQLVAGLTLSRPVKQLVRHQSLAWDHYTTLAGCTSHILHVSLLCSWWQGKLFFLFFFPPDFN